MNERFLNKRQEKQNEVNLRTESSEAHQEEAGTNNDRMSSFSVLVANVQSLPKQSAQITTCNNQKQPQTEQSCKNSNNSHKRLSSFSPQVISQLLQLQQRWICKQTQIRQYVQSLKKTIEQKELKIERMEKENGKLVKKVNLVEKEKENMTEKLSEIYEVVEMLENQKLRKVILNDERNSNKDSRNSSKEERNSKKEERNSSKEEKKIKQKKLIHQQKLFNETYKPKTPTKTKQQENLNLSSQQASSTYNHQLKQPSPNKSQSKSTQNNQKAHQPEINNLVKMQESNIKSYPYQQSDSLSGTLLDEHDFTRKEREIRQTTTTDHTYEPKVRGNKTKKNGVMMGGERTPEKQEKCEISYLTIQQERERDRQKGNRYKSARTITFSNDQQAHHKQRMYQGNQFHSQNQINSHAKKVMYSPLVSVEVTPQVSQKAIKEKVESEAQAQAQSRMQTIRRNQNICRQQQKELSQQRRQRTSMRLQSQRVHEQIINEDSERKSIRKNQQIDKKSSHNSEDNQFLQQDDKSNRNMHNNENGTKDQSQQRMREGKRKKTRMNTKLTNLDYSLTSSFVSVSQIDGSQFRDNMKSQLQQSAYSVAVSPCKERKTNESKEVQYQDDTEVYEPVQNLLTEQSPTKNIKSSTKTESKMKQLSSQNCQTETQQNTSENQQHLNVGTRKQSMASSSGSRFYYPQKKQEKQHIPIQNPSVQQCNIKNHSRISQAEETNSRKNFNRNSGNNFKQQDDANNNLRFTFQKATQSPPQTRQNSSKQSINNKTLNIQVESNIKTNHQQNITPSNPQTMNRSRKNPQPKIQSNTIGLNFSPLSNNSSKKQLSEKMINNSKKQLKDQRNSIKNERNSISNNQRNSINNSHDSIKNQMNQNHINRSSQDDKSTLQQMRKSPKLKQNYYSNNNFYPPNNKKFDPFSQQSTHMKRPQFDSGQFQRYTVSAKSNKSAPLQLDEYYKLQKERARLFPDSKSTSFKQHGTSYYREKSNSSSDELQNNHSFKKLYKFTTESSQEEQHQQEEQRQEDSTNQMPPNMKMNFNKILFENSILKSYNTTLQVKAKKMTKTEKLMEKFSEHNATVLSKIYKKSIS